MLSDFQNCLKPGGYLVYATCTLNPVENQMQVEMLLRHGFELTLPALEDYMEYIVPGELNGKTLGYYLLPGISTGEGLFISVMQKKGEQHQCTRSGQNVTPFAISQ